MKRGLRLYLLAVIAAGGIAVLGALVAAPPAFSGRAGLLATLLTALASLTHVAPLKLAPKRSVILDTSLYTVALLAFAPGEAALLAVLATSLGNLYRRRPWFNVLFNAAQVALSVCGAAIVYRMLAPVSLAEPGHDVRSVLALFPAGALLYLIGTLAVDGAAAIQRRRPLFAGWLAVHGSELLPHVMLVALGAAIAPAVVRAPWLLPFATAPVVVVYATLRASLRFRSDVAQLAVILADAVAARHPALEGRSQRLAALAQQVGEVRGLGVDDCRRVWLAARLHDLGLADVPTQVVGESGGAETLVRLRDHGSLAAAIGQQLGLVDIAEVLRYHDESFDGNDSPHDLAGMDIPLESRILAVCDAWLALTSPCSYRPALTVAQALVVLEAGAGAQWDPQLVTIVRSIVERPAVAPQERSLSSPGGPARAGVWGEVRRPVPDEPAHPPTGAAAPSAPGACSVSQGASVAAALHRVARARAWQAVVRTALCGWCVGILLWLLPLGPWSDARLAPHVAGMVGAGSLACGAALLLLHRTVCRTGAAQPIGVQAPDRYAPVWQRGPGRRARPLLGRTRSARARKARRAGPTGFRSLTDSRAEIVMMLRADGTSRYVSPAIAHVLGYRAEDLVGPCFLALIHPEDVPRALGFYLDCLTRPGGSEWIEVRGRDGDGSCRHLELSFTNLLADPSLGGVVLTARDITERKALEEQLRHRAFHDPLTGLANRALFLDRLGHALAAAERHGSLTAVLLLDLDHFKLVNDSYGHAAGDQLVVAVGRRLAACVRPGDTVARFGGDEFTLVLEDVGGPAEAMAAAERILAALREPFPVDTAEVYVTASVGVAVSGGGTVTPETLFRNADTALYRAKGSGRARAVLFEPAMSAAAVARQALNNDLRRAVARGELRLHYQPEVDLASGVIVGAEALVRWQRGAGGLVAPDDFITVAEETGVILAIGDWVLREACRQAATWQALRPDGSPLLVGVNICARQLTRPDFAGRVRQVLEETGLPATCLRLEITETVVMEDVEVALAALATVRALGAQVALDDFGTGYSSLNYLQRLPVDVVKIDRSFIRELDHDGPTMAIVQAVVTLAHALGLTVAAEGIETADQLARARSLGCDTGQGYYFAEALSADALTARLSRTPATSRSVLPQPGAEHRPGRSLV